MLLRYTFLSISYVCIRTLYQARETQSVESICEIACVFIYKRSQLIMYVHTCACCVLVCSLSAYTTVTSNRFQNNIRIGLQESRRFQLQRDILLLSINLHTVKNVNYISLDLNIYACLTIYPIGYVRRYYPTEVPILQDFAVLSTTEHRTRWQTHSVWNRRHRTIAPSNTPIDRRQTALFNISHKLSKKKNTLNGYAG